MSAELGSFLLAIAGIPLAFLISGKGDDMWRAGRRGWGGLCFCVGMLLAFESTIGFAFGFDLWRFMEIYGAWGSVISH